MNESLGQVQETFSCNKIEWYKALTVLGTVAALGVAGVAFGIYDSVMGGALGWICLALGLAVGGFAGYFIHISWPTMQSFAICENGLRMNDSRFPAELLWDQISAIEESDRDESTRQIFIQKADETGYLTNSITLDRYDLFVEMMRNAGAEHGIIFRSAPVVVED